MIYFAIHPNPSVLTWSSLPPIQTVMYWHDPSCHPSRPSYTDTTLIYWHNLYADMIYLATHPNRHTLTRSILPSIQTPIYWHNLFSYPSKSSYTTNTIHLSILQNCHILTWCPQLALPCAGMLCGAENGGCETSDTCRMPPETTSYQDSNGFEKTEISVFQELIFLLFKDLWTQEKKIYLYKNKTQGQHTIRQREDKK